MTLWEKIVDFINSKEVGTIIKRKELLELDGYNLEKGQTSSFNTVDSYRLILTNTSHLEKCKKNGWYKLINKVPNELSFNDLRYGWTSKLVKRRKIK